MLVFPKLWGVLGFCAGSPSVFVGFRGSVVFAVDFLCVFFLWDFCGFCCEFLVLWVSCGFFWGPLKIFYCGLLAVFAMNLLWFMLWDSCDFCCGFFLEASVVGFLRFLLWTSCGFCCGFLLAAFVVGFLRCLLWVSCGFCCGLLADFYYGYLAVFCCGLLAVFAVGFLRFLL